MRAALPSNLRFIPWAVAAAALAGLLGSMLGNGLGAGPKAQFWLGLGGMAVCTIPVLVLLLKAVPPPPLDWRLAVVPLAVLAIILSFFANGFGSVLAHQAAWGLIAVGGLLLVAWRLGLGMFPMWLVLFTGALATLSLAAGASTSVLFDVALSAIVLFTAWHVAGTFSDPGGVTRFLGYVAIAYWAVTAAAIIVGETHVSLGSMTPATVQLPWVGGIDHNTLGYGVVSVQAGRMLTAIICAYHVSRFRSGKRDKLTNENLMHALLGVAAAGVFFMQYGRIPLLSGIVIIAILLATTRRGTNVWALGLIAVVVVFGFASGGSDSGGFSLRLGASGWDSGHVTLWAQQMTLFADRPVAGVGLHATNAQLLEARTQPVFSTLQNYGQQNSALTTALEGKGSGGEGGWTGMLAQIGSVGSAVVLALIIAAFATVFYPMRKVPEEAVQDRVLLRAVLVAALLMYLTDLQPAGFTTLPDYVVLQLTMIAAVTAIKSRFGGRGSAPILGRP